MKPKKFFEARARSARMWASQWSAFAGDLPVVGARIIVAPPGTQSQREAQEMAAEWHARAELAEAYARRHEEA
jgi:hypothetical protein